MTVPAIWIGTSWKMNKTLGEAELFASRLAEAPDDDRIQRFVIPPFTVARQVKQRLCDTTVKVGAQNMHWADDGAWTGEISPVMLTDCGLDLVELGHSERRHHFGETDATVGLKTAAALRHGLTPLICVGETLAQRDAGQASDVLRAQVTAALNACADSVAPILFAYEPVWAIGEAGIPASAPYANARQAEIAEAAEAILKRPVPCLYGGSVTAENCTDFIGHAKGDGLFIGRAAWRVDGYIDILNKCAAVL